MVSFLLSACQLEIKPPHLPDLSGFNFNIGSNSSGPITLPGLADGSANKSEPVRLASELEYLDFLDRASDRSEALLYFPESFIGDLKRTEQKDYTLTESLISTKDESFSSNDDIFKNSFVSHDLSLMILDSSVLIFNKNEKGERRLASELSFDSTVSGIYLKEKSLLIRTAAKNNESHLQLFDISDPSKPEIVLDESLKGNYVGSLVIASRVYLFNQDRKSIQEERDSIYMSPSKASSSVSSSWNEVYAFDFPFDDFISLASIYSLDLFAIDEQPKESRFLLPADAQILLSQGKAFVSYEHRLDRLVLEREALSSALSLDPSGQTAKRLRAIANTDSLVLNDHEKTIKAKELLFRHFRTLADPEKSMAKNHIESYISDKLASSSNESSKSLIQTFNLEDGFSKLAKSSVLGAKVPAHGIAFNPENSSLFVIAKKDQTLASENALVLFSLDQSLTFKDSLDLPRHSERGSAAFIGNSVFVSDMAKPDKVLLIDLSNSQDLGTPKELKLPADSHWSRLVDSQTLLVGSQRQDQSFVLSLFDIKDPSQMKEISSITLGGRASRSRAVDDKSLFFYSSAEKIFSLPINAKNNTSSIFGNKNFDGLSVFSTEERKLRLRGLIESSDPNIRVLASDKDFLYVLNSGGVKLYSQKSLQPAGDFPLNSGKKTWPIFSY